MSRLQTRLPNASIGSTYRLRLAVSIFTTAERTNPMKTEALHPVEREHVWTYFALHAQQRLTTFNFYIVLSAAIIAASAALIKVAAGLPYAVVPLGAVLSLLSFVFWKLDTRNKQLIKNAEDGLRYVEEHLGLLNESSQPLPTAVFLRDAEYVERQRQRGHRSHWSYSKCFNSAFITLGTVGALSALVVVVLGALGR